jgi:hypothetical protein
LDKIDSSDTSRSSNDEYGLRVPAGGCFGWVVSTLVSFLNCWIANEIVRLVNLEQSRIPLYKLVLVVTVVLRYSWTRRNVLEQAPLGSWISACALFFVSF